MTSTDFVFNERDLGHGASETILHPAVLVALLLTIVLVLGRPRKYAVMPLMMATFLIPRGQEIYLSGQHLYVMRIVVLLGLLMLARARFRIAGGINSIDRAFILWALYRFVAAMLTNGSSAVSIQVAVFVETFGGYFMLRCLIQDEQDIARAAKALALVAAILGLCMLNEHIRNVNIFGYLGGASLVSEMRNGHARAQATFGHSILAGSFGGTLVPLFFWLWKSGNAKALAAVGMAGAITMVFMSNSSTPLLALGAGVGALLLWPIRGSMRAVRWGIVLALAILAIVMKAPVWFVIAHVNPTGSSAGWDRANLIDVCIRHIRDWWLIGTNQNGTWGWDMWDLSDQFVAEAEMGGLLTLICFIAVISRSFSRLGIWRKQVHRNQEWLAWSLGAVMLAHIFAYFGVAYWDNTKIWWFAFLAMVSAATAAPGNSTALGERIVSTSAGTLSKLGADGWLWHTALHSR